MKKSHSKKVNLTLNEALVLQQVFEDGSDDTTLLSFQTGMPKHTILHIVSDLRDKGFVILEQTCSDVWVRLSSKGKKLVSVLWPEASTTCA